MGDLKVRIPFWWRGVSYLAPIMTSIPNPKAGAYYNRQTKWKDELLAVREILLSCPLTEEIKWGAPTYTVDDANVVSTKGFKEHVVLMFFKGALIDDTHNLLIQPTEQTQAMRQMRLTSTQQIKQNASTIRAYVNQAIKNEKAGLKVKTKSIDEWPVPQELADRFAEEPQLQKAFKALTPGRQRQYMMHIGAAKLEKTRIARVDKAAPLILAGKGLDD